MAKVVVEAPSTVRVIERDIVTGTITVRAEENDGRAVIADTGVEIGRWVKERLAITAGDPLSAETEMGSTFTYAKGPGRLASPASAGYGRLGPSGSCPRISTPGRGTRRSSVATRTWRSPGISSDNPGMT